MSMRNRLAVAGACFLFVAPAGAELSPVLKPGLGQPVAITAAPVATPDGDGLPAGRGSVADGKVLYEAQCAACHGVDGRLAGNALAGGNGTLATSAPQKTVGSYWPYATTLFDYINRAMPYGRAAPLPPADVYAVTAYVLHLNGLVAAEATLDAAGLTAIRMPNAGGFVELPGYMR